MYLLTWNPLRWAWDSLTDDVTRVRESGSIRMTWSCGRNKRIGDGDRLYLMRLGMDPKGIVGSAVALGAPFEGEHWDTERAAAGETGLFIEANFDFIAAEPVVALSELERAPFSEMHWTPQASGTRIPSEAAAALDQLWARKTGAGAAMGPDEMLGDGLVEGASLSVTVNAYERNAVARRRCLEHYGAKCFVCGMSFGESYGSFALGYMHVHHVRPLSALGDAHVVDPVQDLRPLCPNCHAAIHLSSPLMTPEALRAHVTNGRKTG